MDADEVGRAGRLRAQRRAERAALRDADEMAGVDFTCAVPATGAAVEPQHAGRRPSSRRPAPAPQRMPSRRPRAEAEIAAVDFDCAVPMTGKDTVDGPKPVRRTRRARAASRGRMRRRVNGAAALLVAVLAMAGVYSLFASTSTAQAQREADPANGRALYEISCITCHGANLQGVDERGPSLIGAGGAATYFQVATGRMPVAAQGADQRRKPTTYSADEINDLVAFVQSVAGGPDKPSGSLRNDGQLAEGGELFRLNCASCHNFAGKGAALSAGKVAPGLNAATDLELYTAMLTGPENMPVFGNNQLTPDQKKAIISYIQTLKKSKDPGGQGLDRIGPVSEGLIIWVIGVGILIGLILWIGAKS